jgi:predicted RNase H-like HicB family nuclease
MKIIRATFTVTLPFRIQKEGSIYISSCPPLDVFSQGETIKKAEENLIEAVRLFINSCFVRGTLDKVLRQCGFVPMTTTPKPAPRKPPGRQITVPVPFPFVFHDQRPGCQG